MLPSTLMIKWWGLQICIKVKWPWPLVLIIKTGLTSKPGLIDTWDPHNDDWMTMFTNEYQGQMSLVTLVIKHCETSEPWLIEMWGLQQWDDEAYKLISRPIYYNGLNL